jgi:hypothetical protein
VTLPRNFPGRVNTRHRAALKRIERQLLLGKKTAKRTHPFHRRETPLSVEDRNRLYREADRLTLLLTSDEQARAVRTKKDRSGTGKLTRIGQ